MQKKNLKPLILSSLAAAAMAGVGAGATFALFTDKAETQIDVTTGILDVSSAIENFKVYSAKADNQGTLVDENQAKYVSELQTAVDGNKHLFANKGYATFGEGAIGLTNITPGDKVQFDLDLDSGSTNISYKYRVFYRVLNPNNVTDKSHLALVKGLTTSIGEGNNAETFKGLVVYQSDWHTASAAQTLDPLHISIELPIDKGNIYQNKGANIVVGIEAVQGNASVASGSYVETIEEDISVTKTSDGSTDLVLNGVGANTNIATTATIPASAVAANKEITYVVEDLGITDNEATTTASLDFDVSFLIDGAKKEGAFDAPVSVTFDIGPDKTIASIKHKGNEMPASAWSYDAGTGVVTITSTEFSPFTIDYLNVHPVKNIGELNRALTDGYKKIAFADDISATSPIMISDGVTIFGNGKKLVTSGKRAIRVDANDVKLAINDLEIVGENQCERGIQVDSDKTGVQIELNNVHVKNITMYAINMCSNVTVNFTAKDCSFAGWAALNVYSRESTFTFNNCSLTGTNDKNVGNGNNFAVICLEADTTYQTSDHSIDNIVTLNECTITAVETNANIQYIVSFNNGNPGSLGNSLITNNCKFNVANPDHVYYAKLGVGNSWVNDGKEVLLDATIVSYDFTGITIEEDGYTASGIFTVEFEDGTNAEFDLSKAKIEDLYDDKQAIVARYYLFEYQGDFVTYELGMRSYAGTPDLCIGGASING